MFQIIEHIPLNDQFWMNAAISAFCVMVTSLLWRFFHFDKDIRHTALGWGVMGFFILAAYSYYATQEADKAWRTATKVNLQVEPVAHQMSVVEDEGVVVVESPSGRIVSWRKDNGMSTVSSTSAAVGGFSGRTGRGHVLSGIQFNGSHALSDAGRSYRYGNAGRKETSF